jgi:glutamate synthase domain-containing protein 1
MNLENTLEKVADCDYRVPSGCSVMGVMSEKRKKFTCRAVMRAIGVMRERTNGLGGGYAAYGIYPRYANHYAFHLLYDDAKAKEATEQHLEKNFIIDKYEAIPTREVDAIKSPPLLWRYFMKPKDMDSSSKDDYALKAAMHVNRTIKGAYVISSGKNMGIFKGVGYPEDIGRFFKLENYRGYLWTAHGRFPTNSVSWWGGAHPFGLLDWSVIHNGEISSYGINRRFLLNFGYHCTLSTDTEVIAYLFDFLVRKQGLAIEVAAGVLAAQFWDEIGRLPEQQEKLYLALRMAYGGALLNGPFSVIVGCESGMIGLNDRIKLRPLVAARGNKMLYISSEEAGIREICPSPDQVWMPEAGEPVIGRFSEGENG